MKTPRQEPPRAADRNDRLKAALKANIARRKAQAQAQARAADPRPDDEQEKE
ncbi:hypothetical protein [Limimaricola hongkongensis]|uniref:Uncharacterized protein n=1 Tax=Limimaricola hongkongensis DSM 17492 TaxID=1122180 RepID=A0A017HAM1_9RHOB|nr:hypothetical protein [Limimaricola hongkongensis]EYD70834.1 hypothetical protein Lokhon_02477 [Limimaricola hongkongensis DSM 17492]